ncbi:MAG: hypothetical protein COA44_15875 [Arcobacter sp.]|nr:MAG: hypothetical protein COA44_15875 [Arcobacter sp.]
MKSLLFILILEFILCAEVRITQVTYTSIMLMTEKDIYKEGYIIGIDVAREMRKIEATALMQDIPPVQATSFCTTSANEAYSLDEQFTYKLAEKNNGAIFKDGIRVGCLEYMQGKASTYRRVIKEEEGIDATDVNAINALLQDALPPEAKVQKDTDLQELTNALHQINTLYQ